MYSGLDSAKAKIVRAKEHLNSITDLIVAEVNSRTGTYEIIEEPNGKKTVKFSIQPPDLVSVFAGEIIYHLRSTLDHLAFDLVRLTGKPINSAWEENCVFPLWLVRPKNKPTTYNCFDNLPGIPQAAFTFIESLQPYHTGEGPHNIMRIIAKLSNLDKHRHLNAILPRIAVRQDFIHASGMKSATVIGGFNHGAELRFTDVDLGENNPVVDMKTSFIPYVTFAEIAIGTGPASVEAQNVLQLCLDHVESTIIPAFINFLRKS